MRKWNNWAVLGLLLVALTLTGCDGAGSAIQSTSPDESSDIVPDPVVVVDEGELVLVEDETEPTDDEVVVPDPVE